jgi:hypothetical protein
MQRNGSPYDIDIFLLIPCFFSKSRATFAPSTLKRSQELLCWWVKPMSSNMQPQYNNSGSNFSPRGLPARAPK